MQNQSQSQPSHQLTNSPSGKAQPTHSSQPVSNQTLDLAIIGSGPAALTAALYAARAGLYVAVFERLQIGGTVNQIFELANFPAFSGTGQDFINELKRQATQAGAEIYYGECTAIQPPQESESQDGLFALSVDSQLITARAVLVATGSEPRRLDIDLKRSVSYCAICDAPLYKGKNVAVVGGGNSAAQEALYLSDVVANVTLLVRSSLKADPIFIEQLRAKSNIKIEENTPATPDILDAFDGAFVFIGSTPATAFLPTEVLNKDGFVITDQAQMTIIPGLFAAGDVRQGSIKQIITAAADGAVASVNIVKYLQSL